MQTLTLEEKRILDELYISKLKRAAARYARMEKYLIDWGIRLHQEITICENMTVSNFQLDKLGIAKLMLGKIEQCLERSIHEYITSGIREGNTKPNS